MQNGFKKCIFYGTPSPGLAKASLVYLGMENKPISLPLFWPGPSTPNFHQNYENPNIPLKEVKHKDSDIFRRCASLGSNSRGGFKCSELIDFSIAKPRICDQSKEITASVCTRNRVSGAFC